jgi:hypothetical protein
MIQRAGEVDFTITIANPERRYIYESCNYHRRYRRPHRRSVLRPPHPWSVQWNYQLLQQLLRRLLIQQKYKNGGQIQIASVLPEIA